jgi:hypothetical protein
MIPSSHSRLECIPDLGPWDLMPLAFLQSLSSSGKHSALRFYVSRTWRTIDPGQILRTRIGLRCLLPPASSVAEFLDSSHINCVSMHIRTRSRAHLTYQIQRLTRYSLATRRNFQK